ncbi:MAG: MoxR family ATPase, partial [Planctomycetota bacterium]|nr:MoxR family ATPase [Planctomycetota bacterium]
HVLLEGVPGIGKTTLVRVLSEAVDVNFSRIQFSPDLMPADIVGTNVLVVGDDGSKHFRFQKGPVFANVLLADEINRATPKTQAALLEAMQEHRVTVGGETYVLEQPFFVLGTQNPIEMEGTYPLPEAQVDRFLFKLNVGYLNEDELMQVVDRTTTQDKPEINAVLRADRIRIMREAVRQVQVAEHVKRYGVRIISATHPGSDAATEMVNQYLKLGSSPRGIQAIMLAGKVRALVEGRFHLSCDDIRAVAMPALRHRCLLNFEGEAEGISTDAVVNNILEQVQETAPQGAAN